MYREQEESVSYREKFLMNEQSAIRKVEEVEKKIEELEAGFAERQLELLSKEENELTRREKAELARYDSKLAKLEKDKADWIDILIDICNRGIFKNVQSELEIVRGNI